MGIREQISADWDAVQATDWSDDSISIEGIGSNIPCILESVDELAQYVDGGLLDASSSGAHLKKSLLGGLDVRNRKATVRGKVLRISHVADPDDGWVHLVFTPKDS